MDKQWKFKWVYLPLQFLQSGFIGLQKIEIITKLKKKKKKRTNSIILRHNSTERLSRKWRNKNYVLQFLNAATGKLTFKRISTDKGRLVFSRNERSQ